MSDETSHSAPQPRASNAPRRRRPWLFVLFIGIAAVFGFAAGNVHSLPWQHWGWHHRFDTEEINFFVQHRVNRALSEVDATPEQREKADAIAKKAVEDLMAMRNDQESTRGKVLAVLTADTIDRSALEALRAEKLSMADAASKRVVQVVADIADVLKPEQRRKLAEHWKERNFHP